MKSNFLTVTLAILLVACSPKKEKESASSANLPEKNAVESISENESARQDLDWNNIPLSDKDLGTLPYFSAPEGTYIQDGKQS